MSTLLSSPSFWLLVLTVLAVFVSFCYLSSLYKSFNIPWGNVAVSDVLIKGFPAIGVVVVAAVYLASDPAFPWHQYLASLPNQTVNLIRFLLPVTAASALVATGIGKLRAILIRRSSRRANIENGDGHTWCDVIVVAFGKDLLAFFDPETKKSYLVPWSEIKKIEADRPHNQRLRYWAWLSKVRTLPSKIQAWLSRKGE